MFMDFTDYVLSFYSAQSELYPELKMTREEVLLATAMLQSRVEDDFVGDSFDRETVRDIVLNEIRTGVYLCETEVCVPVDVSDSVSAEQMAGFIEEISDIVSL